MQGHRIALFVAEYLAAVAYCKKMPLKLTSADIYKPGASSDIHPEFDDAPSKYEENSTSDFMFCGGMNEHMSNNE